MATADGAVGADVAAPAAARERERGGGMVEDDDEDGALQVFDVEEAGGVEFAAAETSKPDPMGTRALLADGGDSVIGYYALRSEGGRLRVAGGPQWLTPDTHSTRRPPSRHRIARLRGLRGVGGVPLRRAEATRCCSSCCSPPPGCASCACAVRARAGGLRKLPLGRWRADCCCWPGRSFRLCGGPAEGRGDKAFRYAGFEDARGDARGELYLIANHEDCGRRRLCLLKLGLTGGDGDGGGRSRRTCGRFARRRRAARRREERSPLCTMASC